MKAIYKYALEIEGRQTLAMPEDAIILCVQNQNERPCIWAVVNTDSKIDDLKVFYVFGTGHPMTAELFASLKYIGTFQYIAS